MNWLVKRLSSGSVGSRCVCFLFFFGSSSSAGVEKEGPRGDAPSCFPLTPVTSACVLAALRGIDFLFEVRWNITEQGLWI